MQNRQKVGKYCNIDSLNTMWEHIYVKHTQGRKILVRNVDTVLV